MSKLEKDTTNRNQKLHGNKVIFLIYPKKERYRYMPYPMLYRQPDTDYICFTDDVKIKSKFWDVRYMERLDEEKIGECLKLYASSLEIKPDQIQLGPLSGDDGSKDNLVTVPVFDELPQTNLDLSKFTPTADKKGNYIYRKNPVLKGGKYNGRPLLLTIGVPVSNQIDTIDRCLSHIKPLLDKLDSELIVIDTGSTDGTLEVCERYGARIISHPWCDNMSAVRNEAIYNAKGEWFMSIDDDEWFEDVDGILQFFLNGTYRHYEAATYIQRNYIDSDGKKYSDFPTPRMARIVPEIHFEGRIHDAIEFPSTPRIYATNSYAHHYGFVQDQPEMAKKKSERNISILSYDVYEYPDNFRYAFQFANEYHAIMENETAIALFAQIASLAKLTDNDRRGAKSITEILLCLYDADDSRLFEWAKYLSDVFPLKVAEQASIAWCLGHLAFRHDMPSKQLLKYYDLYKSLCDKYWENREEALRDTYCGAGMVEHKSYILQADEMAFCAYVNIGEADRALEILPSIAFDEIEYFLVDVLAAGLSANEPVFNVFCDKITPMKWEEWGSQVLDALIINLSKEGLYERIMERIATIVLKISVSTVMRWLDRSEVRHKPEGEESLARYATDFATRDGNLVNSSVQNLCLCAWILKETYVKNRESENSEELFYCYITVMGAFAERYYNADQLISVDSCVVSPDIRAVYRMYVVLADGKASKENVAILKQALEIFPSFHDEIKIILKGLV